MADDLSQFSMWDLFRMEAQNQNEFLSAGLLQLETEKDTTEALKLLMRSAHSLKGAARVVDLKPIGSLAHAMEDVFQVLQKKHSTISSEQLDVLLAASDYLVSLETASDSKFDSIVNNQDGQIEILENNLRQLIPEIHSASDSSSLSKPDMPAGTGNEAVAKEKLIRVSAEQMQQLTALSGEIVINTEYLTSLSGAMAGLRKMQYRLLVLTQRAKESLPEENRTTYAGNVLAEMQRLSAQSHHEIVGHLNDIDSFSIKMGNLAGKLNRQAMQTRMRPFSDGTKGLARLVRDLAKSLKKEICLDIQGLDTPIDRDVLERLDAPINHLIRNAADHGLETPTQREAAKKSKTGTITLRASHKAGTLSIYVEDDGRGINVEVLRNKILEKSLLDAEATAKLSDMAVLEFLFSSGFSTRDDITDISGRGVGLDAVRTDVQAMGGLVRVTNRREHGSQFTLQLPITHSVVRSLMVEISDEPYSFPLTRINRILEVTKQGLIDIEGQPHVEVDGEHIPIFLADRLIGVTEQRRKQDNLTLVLIGQPQQQQALCVDRLLGEADLVVRPLDPRLGSIDAVSATSITKDGDPILILDVDSLQSLIRDYQAPGLASAKTEHIRHDPILIAEDSLAVRELTRRQLENIGYTVEVAVDGQDAWDKLQLGRYSLLITDLEMPRLNGLQLTRRIRRSPKLRALPVIMYTTLDEEDTRRHAVEAGVDAFKIKNDLQDGIIESTVFEFLGSEE